MFKYIREKLHKSKLKREFREYGYELIDYDIPEIGRVTYAQWQHPFESVKEMTKGKVDYYRTLSKEGGMIIDIGAHTGDTTVPMGLAVGAEGLVLGLEPNKYVFKVLEKNATLNKGMYTIHPLCFAATEEDGEMEFHYSDASFCNGGNLNSIQNQRHGHSFALKVKGRNLANYLNEHYSDRLKDLCLIKVDAEGYDKEILKTLKPVIEAYRPNIVTECYKRLTKEERFDLYDTIAGFGYDVFLTDLEEEVGLDKPITREQMLDQKHFDILGKPKL